MKTTKKLLIITTCAIFTNTLFSAPDCMDTNGHLRDKIDYKELRYVDCNHDCYNDPATRIVENRGKCSVCGHYHMPRQMVIVKTQNPKALPNPKEDLKANNPLAQLFSKKNKD